MQSYPVAVSSAEREEETQYRDFLINFQRNFEDVTKGPVPLFTTNTPNLFDVFLAAIPEHRRQHYNCHACRDFVDHYGGLVRIEEDGKTMPVMWLDTYFNLLNPAIAAVYKVVAKAKVTGVFFAKDQVLGKPVTGPWQHMSITVHPSHVKHSKIKTAFQNMAEKKEDFKILLTSLIEYPEAIAAQAVEIFKSGTLARSEHFLAAAKWFHDVHIRCKHDIQVGKGHQDRRKNLVWLAVAFAPPGLCHIKTSMIGTLLDDLKNGIPFDVLRRKFAEKADPMQYQRPQSAPSDGNIDQAEKIIEQLGLSASLKRRLARFDEMQCIWVPSPQKSNQDDSGGVFGHLRRSNQEVNNIQTATVPMTWSKFIAEILPDAKEIEVYVHAADSRFIMFLTAEDPDAPPIIIWDSPEQRNPVSWYVYNRPSRALDWNLAPNTWVKAAGVCFLPSMWNGRKNPVVEAGVVFVLEGCKDSQYKQAGLCLFPEILGSALHSVRRTIEAFSQKGVLSGDNEQSVGGLVLQKGQQWDNFRCRVTVNGVTTIYQLDRWD